MKKSHHPLIMGLGVMVIAMVFASVAPAMAATFTVNSTDDAVDAAPGNGKCESTLGNDVCTLRAASELPRSKPRGINPLQIEEARCHTRYWGRTARFRARNEGRDS